MKLQQRINFAILTSMNIITRLSLILLFMYSHELGEDCMYARGGKNEREYEQEFVVEERKGRAKQMEKEKGFCYFGETVSPVGVSQ